MSNHAAVIAGTMDAAFVLAAHVYDRRGRDRDIQFSAREQAYEAAEELRNVPHAQQTPRRLAMLRELVRFERLTTAELIQIIDGVKQNQQQQQPAAVAGPSDTSNQDGNKKDGSPDAGAGAQSGVAATTEEGD
jgi:hypothetical protein